MPYATLLAVLLSLVPIGVQAGYLGDLSDNELNPHSIFNDIGPYGILSPTSPRNPIGLYGSPISPYSAVNPMAIDPPRLYDQDGNFRGKKYLKTSQKRYGLESKIGLSVILPPKRFPP